MFLCMVCLLQQQLYQITLDTMLKHPQITNLELCFQNKSILNNLDRCITFLYQYAWLCVCQQKVCMLRAVTCMKPWWLTLGAICEKSSSMTPYEWICQLMSRDGSVQKQSGLYQTMTPNNFLLQPLENRQFNMYLNGTCVSLCAPLRHLVYLLKVIITRGATVTW